MEKDLKSANTLSTTTLFLATAELCCRWDSVSSSPGGRRYGGHPIIRSEVGRRNTRALETEWVIA